MIAGLCAILACAVRGAHSQHARTNLLRMHVWLCVLLACACAVRGSVLLHNPRGSNDRYSLAHLHAHTSAPFTPCAFLFPPLIARTQHFLLPPKSLHFTTRNPSQFTTISPNTLSRNPSLSQPPQASNSSLFFHKSTHFKTLHYSSLHHNSTC